MEKKLKGLFDYQRFAPSSKLAKLISETEARYGTALSDDDLGFVAAAGEVEKTVKDPEDELKK